MAAQQALHSRSDWFGTGQRDSSELIKFCCTSRAIFRRSPRLTSSDNRSPSSARSSPASLCPGNSALASTPKLSANMYSRSTETPCLPVSMLASDAREIPSWCANSDCVSPSSRRRAFIVAPSRLYRAGTPIRFNFNDGNSFCQAHSQNVSSFTHSIDSACYVDISFPSR